MDAKKDDPEDNKGSSQVILRDSETTNPDVCRCKQPDQERESWFRKSLSQQDKCKKCCGPERFTVSKLLKLCEQDPDCIINMYKLRSSSDKCLPELDIENDAFIEALVEDGDNKYHYLMKDDSTHYENPKEDKESTYVCEKIKTNQEEHTYVCKQIQTEEEPHVTLEVNLTKSPPESTYDIGIEATTVEKPVQQTSDRGIINYTSHTNYKKESKPLVDYSNLAERVSQQSHNLSVLNYVIKQQQQQQRQQHRLSNTSPEGSQTSNALHESRKSPGLFRCCHYIKSKWRKRSQKKDIDEQHLVKVVYIKEDTNKSSI